MTGIISFITAIISFFGGMPIAFALIFVGTTYILLTGDVPLAVVVQRVASTVSNSTFLAFPFFMLSADLMNNGGVTKKLVRFCKALVGSLPGGLAIVVAASSMIFAALTGSAIATVAAIGTLLFPALIKAGYKPAFAGAVIAAASVMGPIIPPSGSLIMWGITANVSVGKLLAAGWIPGLMMGLFMMLYIRIIAIKKELPKGDAFNLKELLSSTKEALPALGMPVLVLVTVYGGICTVSESAVLSVFYALFLDLVVYKDLKISQVPKIISRAAMSSAGISLIVGGGAVLSWVLTREQIPQAMVNWFSALSSNSIVTGFVIFIFLLILGCIMDNLPAIIMLSPLLDTLGKSFGYNSVHWGFFCTYILLLGLLTPPVGLVLFVTVDLCKVPFKDLVKEVLPFVYIFIIIGVLVLLIPELTMFLPNLFMGVK